MRKKAIGLAIVVPLLLGLGIVDMAVTYRVTAECAEIVMLARDRIAAGDFAGAEQALQAAKQRFDKSEPLLRIWETHADIDAVMLAFRCASDGLSLRSAQLALEHTSALLQALGHLDHQDDFSFLNIF